MIFLVLVHDCDKEKRCGYLFSNMAGQVAFLAPHACKETLYM